MNTVLHAAILTFIQVLESSWCQVSELGRTLKKRDASEFLSDWAQASWETLVEAAIAASMEETVYLEPYGEGADCNEVGSRVWQPGALPTHAVHIKPSTGSNLKDLLTGSTFVSPVGGILLEQFVAPSGDGWYRSEPPFDHVLVYLDGREKVVPIDEVDFLLVEAVSRM